MSESSKPSGSISPAKRELLSMLMKRDRMRMKSKTKIPRRGPSNQCELSYAQHRLWFVDQLNPGNTAYIIPAAVRLTGRLDVEALERSISEIIDRHEILRTTFITIDGIPVQNIAPTLHLPLKKIDLMQLPEHEREAEALQLINEESQRPFDLSQGPLLRVTVLKLGEELHYALLVMHHIVSDGWSLGVLIREMAALYESFSSGKPSPLPDMPIQYADFAIWQRQWLQGQVLEDQISYWKRKLGDNLASLELPADRPRPSAPTHKGAQQSFSLPQSLSASIKDLSQRENTTLFMTLLALFQTLLYAYSRQQDIVLGTDIANRKRVEVEGLIGFFVNMLVLRTDMSGNPTFLELLKRVREVTLEAYANQDVPFEKLVEELQPNREAGSTPLFQTVFALQNAPMPELQMPGLTLNAVGFDNETAKFDMVVNIWESPEGLIGLVKYSTDIFDSATITRMFENFERIACSVIANPDTQLNSFEILSEQERALLAVETAIDELEESFSF